MGALVFCVSVFVFQPSRLCAGLVPHPTKTTNSNMKVGPAGINMKYRPLLTKISDGDDYSTKSAYIDKKRRYFTGKLLYFHEVGADNLLVRHAGSGHVKGHVKTHLGKFQGGFELRSR